MKAGAEPVLKIGVISSTAYIGDSLNGLDRAIARLIEKLEPILTPHPPSAGCTGNTESPGPTCSIVTADLDKHARVIAELTGVVNLLSGRIEL